MMAWFEQLAVREKLVLGIGFVLAVSIVGWGYIWTPLSQGLAERREAVVAGARFVVDLRRAARVESIAPAARADAGLQTILLLADQTARSQGLSFSQTREDGESTLHVSVRNQAFVALIDWLVGLEAGHGVRAETVTISATSEPGLVNGELTLTRF